MAESDGREKIECIRGKRCSRMQGSQPLAEGKVRMIGRDIGEDGRYRKPNSSSSAA